MSKVIMGNGSFTAVACLNLKVFQRGRLKETAQTGVFMLSPSLLLNITLKLNQEKPNSYYP